MSALYLLYESASGYGLFNVVESDPIAAQIEQVQLAYQDFSRFKKMLHLKAFAPFTSAEHALENCNAVSEGIVSDYLKTFLDANLPDGGGKKKKDKGKEAGVKLGVHDTKIGGGLVDAGIHVEIITADFVQELLRGCRMHFERFIDQLRPGDLEKAQLGLAHSYSRSKVKFNVHKSDNMIIQSIALLDQLDKDINTFAMRVREWYSWHFPELYKIVPENYQYCKLVKLIKRKEELVDDPDIQKRVDEINQILMDEDKAKQVVVAAKSSMGTDVSPVDIINIETFANRVIDLADYRKGLHNYLIDKMHLVAPNTAALLGEQVGARLIAHAGSLTNLAKYPASTVQILGAEKALFRALKTKGNTPKYGLLFHSSFIGKAKAKNKGRISRYLANKCSIASRVDCFSDNVTDIYGSKLKEQVEERLRFYETGATPRKNIDVMREAAQKFAIEENEDDNAELIVETKKKSKEKKKDVDSDDGGDANDGSLKSDKKKKKKDKDSSKRKEPEDPLTSSKKKKKQKTA